VADLIHATSDRAARVAASQLEGRLSDMVGAMNEELAQIRTFVEATIDFPEEDLGSLDGERVAARIGRVADTAQRLSETFREGRMIRDGVRVAITGRVNAGKSSLLNRLVGCDRALVHKTPGTTRDVVEETVNLEGTSFRLRDTAGVRHSNCELEAMGIGLTRREIERADIVMVVFDGSQKFGEEDEAVLSEVKDRCTVMVVNKSDLPTEIDVACIGDRLGEAKPLFVSALTGQGLNKLSKKLVEVAACDEGHLEGVVVTSARHKAALDQAVVEMGRARHSISEGWPLECTEQHLTNAQDHLGTITGTVTTKELLDRIFSTFCIGK
jgi:tRNA modification GTPase